MGWKGKVNDKDFSEFLKGSDIVLLQEIWIVDQINLMGFNFYCVPAFKVNTKGCPLAEHATLVSCGYLRAESIEITNLSHFVQATKVKLCGKFMFIFLQCY